MPNFLKLITLTGFVAVSGAAFAQDSEAPKPQDDAATTSAEAPQAVTEADAATEGDATDGQATTAESETGETAQGLSMGEEVVEENKPGTTYVIERFSDWDLRCVRVPEGQKEPCQLFQLLSDEAGNAIAEVNFMSLSDGGQAVAGATIVAPLETLLTKQLTMSVDGGAKKRYPFRFCSQGGCYSQIGFSNGDIASFKRGASATITIVPAIAPDETVSVKMSLTGFTKAYKALKAFD